MFLVLRVYCLISSKPQRSCNIQATTQHRLLHPSQAFSTSFLGVAPQNIDYNVHLVDHVPWVLLFQLQT